MRGFQKFRGFQKNIESMNLLLITADKIKA